MTELERLLMDAGFLHLTWRNLVMFGIAGVLIYLAVKKHYEPLLLIPIGFGAILANLPGAMLEASSSFGADPGDRVPLLQLIYDAGIRTELLPPLIFLGVGALTDFRPLLSRPITLLLGAAAQVGIFVAALGAFFLFGFTAQQSAAIGIIGGADGPTSIFLTAILAPELLGAVAVAAYGVAARLEFMMIPLAFGVGSALTALVGRAVGAGDWETARRTAWVGGGMAFALCSAVGLAVALWPMGFAELFASDAGVAAIAAQALAIIGPAFGGFGLGMAMYFAAMGANRMRWPLAAGFARLAIAVGGGWLLADVLGFGMAGQFVAVALGITAYGVLAAAGVRRGVWGA